MSPVADTSWLYALLDGEDSHHKKAKGQAEKSDEIHVPPAVLIETMGLLQYRGGGDQAPALAALEALNNTPELTLCSPGHEHDATVRVWTEHPRLTYIDAAGVAAARRLGVDLLTFDRAQKAAHRSGRP